MDPPRFSLNLEARRRTLLGAVLRHDYVRDGVASNPCRESIASPCFLPANDELTCNYVKHRQRATASWWDTCGSEARRQVRPRDQENSIWRFFLWETTAVHQAFQRSFATDGFLDHVLQRFRGDCIPIACLTSEQRLKRPSRLGKVLGILQQPH